MDPLLEWLEPEFVFVEIPGSFEVEEGKELEIGVELSVETGADEME